MTFKEEIKKPFNMVTLSLTVISISLTVLFYFNGRRVREICYQINQPVSKIYDSENSAPTIKLIENDSIPIIENVYLLTGSIWNSGNLPILKVDVREPITISLNNCKRILDYKIINSYDPSVSKFLLTKNKSNSLNVDWAYFDPKYGFNFQIIYLGNEDSDFCIKGKILDMKSFINTKPNDSINKKVRLFLLISYPLVIIFLSLFLYFQRRKRSWDIILFRILLILCSIYFIIYILMTFVFAPTPPF
jgi:hypothetical protein